MHGVIDVNDTITRARDEFPALTRLFGGYFHQDWHEDYPTTAAALSAFLHDASPRLAAETAAEISTLLALHLEDDALGRVLRDGLDCNHVPALDEVTNADWLRQVRSQLEPEPAT